MNLIPIGQLPPLGEVPELMHAMVVRASRYGDPVHAFKSEIVEVPSIDDDEVLIAVMAAGLNYNSIWAAKAYPIDMISLMKKRDGSQLDYHILGSDAVGVVYKKGKAVNNVAIGDEVAIQGGWFDQSAKDVKEGLDPTLSSSFRAWGYETNYGAFAQFAKVKGMQCLLKPRHLTWEEAAVYMVSGVTAYRMLHHYTPNQVTEGDVVLIWGGAGGLGSMAIQLAKLAGAKPIAVVSNAGKQAFCENLGAGVLDRTKYDCWGALKPDDVLPETQHNWKKAAKPFIDDFLALTNGQFADIVLEHPGQSTFPLSLYLCKKQGMVVTCAGTSGYLGSFDLRYLWLHNKRIQGSHYANPEECNLFNELVNQGSIKPILSTVYHFDELPQAMQLMSENNHLPGSIAIRIGSNYS